MSLNSIEFDVIIVGAGISGIGAAYHLKHNLPATRFVILESQASFGGTWLTHRYPGIRSDSDLYTFGYKFKPWTGAPLASAEEIRDYLKEVITDNDIEPNIRYGHRVQSAHWSNDDCRWTLQALTSDGAKITIRTKFLWMCQGYYRHSEGYTPTWPGMEEYDGRIVHPQNWPDDLVLRDKRVVIIGSGATAGTLVPAIADDCAHVTIVQRSPGYYRMGRNLNELADMLRTLQVPEAWIHEIVRRKVLHDQHAMAQRSFEDPEGLREDLLAGVRAYVGTDEAVMQHFTPQYRPWSQRILFVPDGDLFKTIQSGKASIVTDEIDAFTHSGVRLRSGQFVDADVVITATGFNLSVMGDISFFVDDVPVDFAKTVTYRGMMFTGVPNMVWVFGYFRASWTMRADLISLFVCRLLKHMAAKTACSVTPVLNESEKSMPLSPWISPDNFNPGYLRRSIHLLPKCGNRQPWLNNQDYWTEKDEIDSADLNDLALVYCRAQTP